MIVHTFIWLCLVAAATGEEVIKLVTVTLHNGLNVLKIMHRLVFSLTSTYPYQVSTHTVIKSSSWLLQHSLESMSRTRVGTRLTWQLSTTWAM